MPTRTSNIAQWPMPFGKAKGVSISGGVGTIRVIKTIK